MTARIVVIGDAVLDVDVVGTADRLAPDAPVPVVDDPVELTRPGGAALAALLAARAGADVTLVTGLAADATADRLRGTLDGIVRIVALPSEAPTPEKRRVRAGGQCVVRLDRGGTGGRVGPLSRAGAEALSGADGVLVADYGRGITSVPSVRRAISAVAPRPVVWDPHPRGAPPVRGVGVVTPNAAEAVALAEAAGPLVAGGASWSVLARVAADLVATWSAGAVAVTLGERGVLLSHGRGTPRAVPAPTVVATDPCGAGDSLAVSLLLHLATGSILEEAVERAVVDAAGFVAAGGAGALAGTRTAQDRSAPATAGDLAARVHAGGGVVVAAGGCFDLLHAGHVAYLEAARTLGDALIVCLNSDRSVRELKGPDRPVVPVGDRRRVLEALACVDAVEVFDESTPVEALRRLRPDIWAKGGDYAGTDLPETPVLAGWGGQAVALPYVPGRSTTALVQTMTSAVDAATRPRVIGDRSGTGRE